jgi:hypothetical protein
MENPPKNYLIKCVMPYERNPTLTARNRLVYLGAVKKLTARTLGPPWTMMAEGTM